MKKLSGLITLSIATMFLTQSCEKMLFDKHEQDKVENITVNVELKKNEVYNYAIPANLSDDEYKITQQATHYNVSELISQERYTYQPAKNYVGKDQVVIANVEEDHHDGQGHDNGGGGQDNGGCGHHNGGCSNHKSETERVITINFIIKDTPVGRYGATTVDPSF